jgi:uncharacterized membrane protein YccC
VLPGLETFEAFSVAIGLYLVPVGFGMAQSRRPATFVMFTAMGLAFILVLAPENQISYDTVQFYNLGLAVFVGCATGALSFRLFPPLPPALRTHRLLALTVRDLRRLAIDPKPPRSEDWEGRVCGRLAVMPDDAVPLQRSQLLSALSVGEEILELRRIARPLALGPELDAALAAVAHGNSTTARSWLARVDQRLSSLTAAEAGAFGLMRARASILSMSEALAQHAVYFDAGASH